MVTFLKSLLAGKEDKKKTTIVMLGCMDARLPDHCPDHVILRSFGLKGACFLLKVAGGGLSLTGDEQCIRRRVVMSDLKLAVEEGGASHIIILGHQNCRFCAINGLVFPHRQAEFEYHHNALRVAGHAVKSCFQKANVMLGFIPLLDGRKPKISRVEF